MKTLSFISGVGISLLFLAVPASRSIADSSPRKQSVSRMVTWQPKAGKEHDFEEGYKRHLEWHRRNQDTWRWYGWDVISGERDGYFVDGTFFHAWSDLDTPVAPAGDAADNAQNVYPYADVKAVATYETEPALRHMSEEQLGSALITFYSLSVAPGSAEKWESAAADELAKAPAAVHCVIFRPASGTTEYLLAVTTGKVSQLGEQAEFVRGLLQKTSQLPGNASAVSVTRIETARFRQDMSNLPGKPAS